MAFVATTADGSTIHYQDGKRYLWLASLSGPLIPMLAIALYFWTDGNLLTTFFPLAYTFIFTPLADAILGEDRHNPPEEVVPMMSKDNYYRALLYVAVALTFTQFFVVAWFIGTHPLPWWSFLALTLGAGFTSAISLLLGHELGHKPSRADRVTAQIVNGLVGYGHFCIEHNRGHHVNVATPEDHVSARMGESIYKFARREIPGALRRGWALEKDRLAKAGKSTWSLSNEILTSWLLTAAIALARRALRPDAAKAAERPL
jgi:alkane 1-monooxygenase